MQIQVQLLCGSKQEINLTKIVHPGMTYNIEGMGMPHTEETPENRGDMIIEFDVQFPRFWTSSVPIQATTGAALRCSAK